jgi:hypothetical protein
MNLIQFRIKQFFRVYREWRDLGNSMRFSFFKARQLMVAIVKDDLGY